ncbi:MAG: hypothetical protein K2Z80_02700 [Xanthobacteraceae bacterium]|nr:hypothetical protein [Xanthobacteraceae bacterium]
MRPAVLIGVEALGVAAVVTAIMASPLAAQPGRGVAPKGPLNTLVDIRDAIQGCWKWPPLSEVRQGMELTIRLSFKRSGEIFGARLTYETRDVSEDERRLYYGVMLEALKLCSPLPVSESLGGAIAGRPFTFRFKDNRREGKA